MKKEIGRVTESERDEIQALFERRNGLTELAKIVTADNIELFDKLVSDIGKTSSEFQNWWSRMAKKYDWESRSDGNWEINFDDCKIFLNTID